jgi:hypothetical protein
MLGNYRSSSLLFTFHGGFYSSAAQQEINGNTHSQEHGIGYFNRYHKINTVKTESDAFGLFAQLGVLLLGDFLAIPEPYLCAVCLNHSRAIFAM